MICQARARQSASHEAPVEHMTDGETISGTYAMGTNATLALISLLIRQAFTDHRVLLRGSNHHWNPIQLLFPSKSNYTILIPP